MGEGHGRTEAVVAERSLTAQMGLEIGVAGAFTLAIIAAAHLKIYLPFNPLVPLTLQTLVVLLAGGLLGARLGFIATTGYLLLSLLNLPVMAGPSFIGPTGGYVLGFVLAAVLVGYCARRPGWGWLVGGMIAGSVTILLCGWMWLAALPGRNSLQALHIGVLPFLAGDALKTAAAIGLVRIFRPQARRLLG